MGSVKVHCTRLQPREPKLPTKGRGLEKGAVITPAEKANASLEEHVHGKLLERFGT